MPAIYLHSVEAAERHLDAQGHVNNLVFLKWMQQAALAHSAAQGWPAERYERSGFGWVVRSHQIDYLRPAYLGDTIVVATWVANFRRVQSLRRYRFVRLSDQATLAVASTNWAFVSRHDGNLVRVPGELQQAFSLVPEAEEPLPADVIRLLGQA